VSVDEKRIVALFGVLALPPNVGVNQSYQVAYRRRETGRFAGVYQLGS